MVTEQDISRVESWIDSMRPHWIRTDGDVHNDSRFWKECIHSVPAETWYAWDRMQFAMSRSHPRILSRYTYLSEDTAEIISRDQDNKHITRPYDKTGYNKPVFRAALAIKDVIAELTERPFQTKQVTKKVKPSKEQVLAKFDDLRKTIEELFE